MIVDLEEKPGEWFELADGGRMQLKALSTQGYKAIQKQVVQKKHDFVFNKMTRAMERIDYTEINDELREELFWDTIIVAWENLFDGKGNPIPCTKENKVQLMARSTKFKNVVEECMRKLNSIQLEREVATAS